MHPRAGHRYRAPPPPRPNPGLSNALIILVIAIVIGCFAVLWPKESDFNIDSKKLI